MLPFQDLKKTNARFMDACIGAAGRVLRSGRYINGPEVEHFEKEMAAKFGVRDCVGVSTGLDALRLILLAYKELGRLHDGDEVIVPANTFIATFLAVTHCGLKAVAADIDETTFCLDFDRLPLSGNTRAVIPVHLYGRVYWDVESVKRLRDRGILIIEDCAQAIGAEAPESGINGTRQAGSLGDAAAISFYPAKNIGAFGDAGAVLTNDDELASRVRMLANYGAPEKYVHEFCGFNCRLDELQAALLSEKLPYLSEISEARRQNAALYDSLITNPDVIKPQYPSHSLSHVWHQYVIRHPRRDELREFLRANGIATEIHYPVPCHKQPCYSNHPLLKTPGDLLTSEKLAGEILSLPIADVSEEEIRIIASIINQFYA